MVCKNINKRRVLKSTAIGFLLAGLLLLSCSQAVYVEEINADLNNIDGDCKVKILDAMTLTCFLAALVLNLVGSFAKDNTRQLFRSSVKRTLSSAQKRRRGKDGALTAEGVNITTANANANVTSANDNAILSA